MRLPRVRFTVQGLMLSVAVVAGFAWADGLRRRSATFREIAASHAQEETFRLVDFPAEPYPWGDYHAAMRKKYERAARSPWLGVEPDPPAPEAPKLSLFHCGTPFSRLPVAPDPPEPE